MISLDKLQKQDSEYGLRDGSKYSNVRALAADSQPFSLCLGNKTTFYFPIKKYPTIDSLTFPYIN
jgi:hypothetical protein